MWILPLPAPVRVPVLGPLAEDRNRARAGRKFRGSTDAVNPPCAGGPPDDPVVAGATEWSRMDPWECHRTDVRSIPTDDAVRRRIVDSTVSLWK